ncbi:MAG: C40 family peptidase [Bacteroidota bacterium]
MNFLKGIFVVATFLLFGQVTHAQVIEFDQLEMLYAQGHYKAVYRKANRLLDRPDFDFSQVPSFYKALSMFQLSQNEHWLLQHKNALSEAYTLFTDVRKSADGPKVLSAHQYEMTALKTDLLAFAADLKRVGDKASFEQIQLVLKQLFTDVPDLQDNDKGPVVDPNEPSTPVSKDRESIIANAKKQLGVPYVWAGDDPQGFDCSGFTGYVYKQAGITLERRAVDQFEKSKKQKEKTVQKGDLVFFDNGSGISHVGIIISDKGKPLTMIHASSSKGVIITDIDNSDYWKKRLYSFGSYLD